MTARSDKSSTHIEGGVYCADFVGRDKNITYGYSEQDVERLIDKVLTFLQAGAVFFPQSGRVGPGEVLSAEINGEVLTFRPGAAQRLGARRDERAYLLSLTVHREYQVWATKFIPLAAQMDARHVVAGLDMPITYSEFCVPQPGAGPEAQVTTIPLDDITDALDKHAAFIILGEPGCGKTTTLQKIAFEGAQTLLGGDPGCVPLFVRLSQQGGRDPFGFLQTEWERRTGSDFADALAAGRVLVLADGINELSREERSEWLKAWRLFTADYAGGNQVVFTSREKDYDRQLDLPRVRVEPLDDERIADYLQRNDAGGLGEMLDDPKTRLRQMARNPFNLSLLTFAYKSNQREMANRGALLTWFVGELFSREERLAHPGWLPRQAQIQALAGLAYTMQAQGESLTFAYQTARAALPESLEFQGEAITLQPADLFRFARAATLLDPAIEPDVRFYHHLLQEYFAACELLRRFESGEKLSRLWKTPRLASEIPPAEAGEWDPLPEPPTSGWEVTTILACGLSPNPAALVEAVRLHNPVLAGRCLDEAGITKPDDVTQKVRADLLADLQDSAVHLRARLQAGYILGRVGDPRFEPETINGVQVILPQMVDVPAGRVLLGSAEDDPNAYDQEKPQHSLDLPAFSVGRWPVTNAEFACFIEAGGYQNEAFWNTDLARCWLKGEDVAGGQFTAWIDIWKLLLTTPNWKEQLERSGSYTPDELKNYEYVAGLSEDELKVDLSRSLSEKSRERPQFWDDPERNSPSQPVVGITWFEARAYCAWLSEVAGREYRLPTESEWEAAARGPQGHSYPWGDAWDGDKANTIEGRLLKLSPVGAYAAAGGVGPCGAEDQCGNVWDWTSSLYSPYPYQIETREDPEADGERVVRGGSWNYNRRIARCAFRYRLSPDFFDNYIGFRVFSPGIVLDSGC